MQKREQFTVSKHLILQPNSLPLKKAERIEVLGPSTNQKPTAFMMTTKFTSVMVITIVRHRQLTKPLKAFQQED